MQYSIPQFIETEDRIIGPLTLKQFLWLLGGGGVLTFLWMITGKNMAVFIVAAIPVGAVFAGLAFVKIHNQTLLAFLTNIASFATSPQLRVWQRTYEHHREPKVIIQKNVKKDANMKKEFTQSRITELAWILDTGGNINNNAKPQNSNVKSIS